MLFSMFIEYISIHALREEGDTVPLLVIDDMGISIHALREEGDLKKRYKAGTYDISIHALREEGDVLGQT